MDLRSSRLHTYETGDDILLYDDVVSHYDESQAYISDESFVPGSEHFVTPEYADGEFQERRTILADGGDQFGVTAVAFDSQEELLWMGNQGGHVTSYYSSELQKHTSFQVHATEDVRCLHTFDNGVLALMPSALRCQMRRGIPIFTHSSENMVQMQCLLQLSPQTLLLGGHTHKLIEFDLNNYQEVNLLDVGKNGCAILRQHSRYICCGDPSGRIELRAPNTLRVEHSLEAHTGSLSDFDIHGNLLVTCGFSNRQSGLVVDRFLMVYDFRMMRAVNPIPLLLDPLLLRFMPSFTSRIAVVSAIGQLQLVDTVPLSEPDLTVYQVNSGNSLSLSLDVSTSCQALAIGDSGGSIHLFSSQNTSVFNNFSQPTEFADPIEPVDYISITDSLAILSSIPLIYTNPPTTTLSDWPKEFLKNVYRPTPPIDPEILRTMKMQGTIGYAPNPNTKLRNQVPYNSKNGITTKDHTKNEENSPVFAAIPKRYRKLDLRYSKSDDLEMEQYNKTVFSGLEATLPNSYCNAMIQVLYFLEPLRHVILSHLCHSEFCLSCELGFLFRMLDVSRGTPCHAGNFLRALRNAHEAAALGLILPDHASNKKTNLIALIQNWNRFILHQIHFELLEESKRRSKENPKAPPFVYKDTDFPSIDIQRQKRKARMENSDEAPVSSNIESKEEETEISRMFGTKQIHVHRCLKCQREVSKESSLLVCNLIYPDNACKPVQFCEVLSQSLCPQQTTPAWCDQCERFQPTEQSRRIKSLPSLLTVNCGMDNNQEKNFWQTQMDILVKNAVDVGGSPAGKPCRYGTACTRPGCRFKHPDRTGGGSGGSPSPSHLYQSHSWLPQHIQVDLRANGQVNITKLDRPDDIVATDKETYVQTEVYDLCAVVCYVHEERKNLVGLINVGPGYHQRAAGSSNSQWYVFNDFSITPVNSQEVVWFSLDWKVPCVLYWTNHVVTPQVLPSPRLDLPVDILAAETCLATSGRGITFTPLTTEEAPGPGDLVAMDAEFVTLNQEESELRSDGKTATVKPSHKSVARISCIRGQGLQKGVPFIDDYISTQEQVVDYLTKFSGIKPGDLDANYSSKHLTTLKSTYLKLRYLVDNGVVFVGHGLRNDFRVINLIVPQDQVKDTVHLFHLPHQRMVSLRFLAWHFLGKKIQSETHDSIEDARAALQLYEKYQELEAKNVVRQTLEDMYKQGISSQWRVPED
ncbi:PAN2-PAN3 deadenylation complex catalytic subunit PAN2 isoform X2 [Macrosteles quadrilineatus]|uniref:PAN2-PAN3 deadenylation complex catalytic subunit PAN2 isoform X2 n=1 Tax=Macrosteles quadrilineatus TaxID=74068 RepID=UPI0023E1E1A7|nr:PAN2-PAN3 deadenylation complex catalytic subunit PAN2 isoform X2 [Macrosteles quadrilineatus]